MSGVVVSFNHEDEEFKGYFVSAAEGTGPGVIVLQEWWGLVDHIKDVCDRLSAAGFTALAPDLYRGKSTTEPDEAGSLMMALNIAETEKILASAASYLLGNPSCASKSLGIVGFCMGGQLAMFAAGQNPVFRATANFYGIHPNVAPNYGGIKGDVLGIFAEHDDYANAASVAEMSKSLTEAGVPHEFKTYAGCHHAFFNDSRPSVHSEPEAADAWNRLLTFFRRLL